MRPVVQLRSSAGLHGADRMVLALDHHLRHGGQPSQLVCIDNHRLGNSPLHEEARRRSQASILLASRGRLDTAAVTGLRAVVRSSNAAIVHAHDPKSVVYAWLATRGLDCRCVATTHGWIESSAALRLYNRVERALLRRYDAVAVVAREQAERLLAAGVHRTRIHAVANGIEIPDPVAPGERLEARRRFRCEPEETVFAAVGRLAPEKNLSLLLRALAGVGNGAPVRLLIAGDGPESATLAQQVQALGLQSQVALLGTLADCRPLYAAMDALLLPSLSEGMPLVVLEAMAAGKPVFASAVGDVPALLAHASSSCLLPLEDAAWTAAMRGAIGLRRTDMQAREYVREHHSAEVMARLYARLYRTLQGDDDVARAA